MRPECELNLIALAVFLAHPHDKGNQEDDT